MGQAGPLLRSQRLRMLNHQGDALRLGMNWTEEDLGKPQVLAYYSEEAIRTVRDFAAHEVVRVLTGKPPHSRVNAAQLAIVRPPR